MATEHRDLNLGHIMAGKSSLTAPFGQMGNTLSIFLVLGAVLFVVIAGLFMVIGAMLGSVAHSTGLAAAPASLFAPAHVLMFVVLVLLLILLASGLRGGRTATAAAAPQPAQLSEALSATATALRRNSAALSAIAGSADPAARTKAVDEARADLEAAARSLDTLATTLRASA
jgi:hypothetical protein